MAAPLLLMRLGQNIGCEPIFLPRKSLLLRRVGAGVQKNRFLRSGFKKP